jgi:hypothetical protein
MLGTVVPTRNFCEKAIAMRIAQVSPPFESVPPTGYGGTERVVATLTDALVRRGHQVNLFASGDSHTSARPEPTVDQARWHAEPALKDLNPFWSMTLDAVLAISRSSTSSTAISTTGDFLWLAAPPYPC